MRLVLLLLLALASPASAQVSVDFTYAAMPVHHVKIGLRQTATAHASGTVTIDGVAYSFTGTIPPTYVRGVGLCKRVDACVMTGTLSNGSTITQAIPVEPTFARTALPVVTTISVGSHSGLVLLPAGKFRRGVVLLVHVVGAIP